MGFKGTDTSHAEAMDPWFNEETHRQFEEAELLDL